jgi:GntR family transcriptional regulator/MocR family aminotransferase
MQVALAIQSGDARTLQEQVFDQIRDMILTGRLQSGDPVPGSRALAEQLGISRNTVIIAYDKLLAEGYLECQRNIGTFVSRSLPDWETRPLLPVPAEGEAAEGTLLGRIAAQAPQVHCVRNPDAARLHTDFWIGRVDARAFPQTEWRRLLEAKLRYGGAMLSQYGDPQGLPELRAAISDHIGPVRGVAVDPDEIVVVGGSQDGLMLIARAFAGFAGTFLHEDPGYQGARYLFEAAGYDCAAVPVDREGLVVSMLPEARNSILYVTPSHQFPTGVTLSLERRLELLAWAERTDSLMLEDDYDGDFRYDGTPLTALRGLDRTGRVIYLGTFSKSLGPSLRLGFIAASHATAQVLARWKQLASNGQPWIIQATMADFMNSGGYTRHLRRIRALYMRRRDTLIAALERYFPQSEITGRRGGMHLSWQVPMACGPAARLQELAQARGIGVYTPDCGGACLSPGNTRHANTLLMGYAAIDEARIERP